MSRERKLLFDAGLVFILGILASGLGYVIRIILAKQLSLEEFGLFFAVFSFVWFFMVFRDFGLSYSLMKFIPEFLIKKQYEKIKASILFVIFVNLFVSFLIAFLFFLFSDYLSESYFKNELSKPILLILSIFFILNTLYRVLMSIFVGFQKSQYYSFDLFFINLFVLIGIFIFKKFGFLSPALSYVFAVSMGVIWGTIIIFKLFNFFKYRFDFSHNLKLKLFSYGLPLMLASIGYMVMGQMDILMITKFRPLADVAVYSVVLPTAMLLITFGGSLAEVLLPFVSEYWAAKKIKQLNKIINEAYLKIFVILVPIGLIFFIFADVILLILFGKNFVSGFNALRILSLGTLFFSVAVINNSIISAMGKPKLVTKIIFIGMFLNIILNLILIPKYGIDGAAIATTLTYILVLILSSYFVSSTMQIKLPISNWIKSVSAGMLTLFIGLLLRYYLNFSILSEFFVVFISCISIYLFLIHFWRVANVLEVILSLFKIIKSKLYTGVISQN
jgi:stage V sporulation protein B